MVQTTFAGAPTPDFHMNSRGAGPPPKKEFHFFFVLFLDPPSVFPRFCIYAPAPPRFPRYELSAREAFVTHGGANSMHEALGCGVPMAVIPIFGDQPPNAEAVAKAQCGVSFKERRGVCVCVCVFCLFFFSAFFFPGRKGLKCGFVVA